jgi:hypothetical protein
MIFALVLGLLAPAWSQPPSPGSGVAPPAAESIAGTVEPGSMGNEVTVTLRNRDAEAAIQQVDLQVGAQPEWLSNIRIDPEALGPLAAGASRRFHVRFDVVETARPGASGVLSLRVVADQGLTLDDANPRLFLTVGPRHGAVETSSGQGAPAAGRLVYVLTGVDAQTRVDHKPKQLGYAIRQTTAGGQTSVEAVWCVDCPSEIVPGEPVHIDVRSRKRFDVPKYSCWSERGGQRAARGEAPVSIGVTFLQPAVFATGGRLVYPSCETLGIKEEHVTHKAEGQMTVQGVRKATAGVTLEDTVSLTADYRPGRTEDRDATHQRFHYSASFGSSGALSRSRSDVHHDVSYRTKLRLVKDVQPASMAIEVGAMTLRYTLVVGGAPKPMTVAAFTLPAEFNRPPLGGSGVAGGAAGPESGDPRAGGGTSTTARPPSEAGGGAQPGATPGPGTGPIGPLREADIAPLIREWLAAAEPPINAQGGRARYDEWGRVIGQVPGGVITGGPRPDDVGSRTPVQYVWDKRNQLDSLRHCTLATYVGRRLAGQSIADCARTGGSGTAGAFDPADLVGRRLREAVALVAAAGLQARPQVGPPAPGPGREGTVASASRKGTDVVLEVYTAAETLECAAALGAWHWPIGIATFSGDASGGRASASGNPHVSAGTWRCIGPNQIEITWNGGRFVDRMRVGADGMVGSNQRGSPLRARRAATTTRVGPGPTAGGGAVPGATTGRGPGMTSRPPGSASAGPAPGSDAERRLGPDSLRFPAVIAGERLNTPHPRSFPGNPNLDSTGFVARPASGWLFSAAGAHYRQMASYGSAFYGPLLSHMVVTVYWSPGPGQQCARPRFEAGSRTLTTPSGPAPSSFYWMSLHPQDKVAHAFLGQAGASLEQLRRKVPEDTAARILDTLLQQVAPYAQSCQ